MASSFCPYALIDGALVASADVRVSPFGEGFQYGYGLFETLRVKRGGVAFFDRHWDRLQRGADALGLHITGRELLRERCRGLVLRNGIASAVLKIQLFREGSETRELLSMRPYPYSEELFRRGFRLRTVTERTLHRDAALKTMNYLREWRARESARANGADEALFLDGDRRLLEGSTTNVFIVIGGNVLTPPASGDLLPGVVRSLLLQPGLDHAAREGEIGPDDLARAEEVFVTNSVLGVMPVAQIDARALDVGRSVVTPKLRRLFEALEDASIAP